MFFSALLVSALIAFAGQHADRGLIVSAGQNGAAQIVFENGAKITVTKESGQAGISEPQTASDGQTAGWLVDYNVPGVSYPVSGTLIVWQANKILQRFSGGQSFYSWTFWAGGKHVAYHTGPLHGEQKSHCELHDVQDGRLVLVWDGDLDLASAKRPAWTRSLNH